MDRLIAGQVSPARSRPDEARQSGSEITPGGESFPVWRAGEDFRVVPELTGRPGDAFPLPV